MTTTNDPYRQLRIALAEGKCVTDCSGADVFKCEYNMEILWWSPIHKEWQLASGIRFGENSRIVPDPSMPEESLEAQEACIANGDHQYKVVCESRGEAECITCGEKLNKQFVLDHPPKSLTYDEALAATDITIEWPGREIEIISRSQFPWSPFNLTKFDLAERRGYRMQIVE